MDRTMKTLWIQERLNNALGTPGSNGVVNRDLLEADPGKEVSVAILCSFFGTENKQSLRILVDALRVTSAEGEEKDEFIETMYEKTKDLSWFPKKED